MDERTTFRAIRKKFRPGGRGQSMPRPLRRGGTREVLSGLFAELGFNTGVEIGTHLGKYAESLCAANPMLTLWCVDPWLHYTNMPRLLQKDQDWIFLEAVARLKPYGAIILKKPSMDALDQFGDKSLDFAYIDGNHHYEFVYEDITCWSKKVKSGGIIACHDFYNIHWPGVTKAVEQYLAEQKIEVWYGTRDRLPSVFWVKP